MSERKRVIVEKNTRYVVPNSGNQKKQTPFLNPYGMSSQQINRANKSIIAHRTGRQTTPKPLRVVEKKTPSPQLLLSVPTNGTKHSLEYPTPTWFRSTEKVDVSVIVPLYKSQLVVKDLISTWPLDSSLSWEIIFVDDACPNNSKEMVVQEWSSRKDQLNHPVGKIIINIENKGYGMACNTGAEYASGDYLIFLNADTRVTHDWMYPIVNLLKDETVGIVGNLQIKEGGVWDGSIDGAGSEWCWQKQCFEHIGRHSYKNKELAQPMTPETAPADIMSEGEREMVTGCCFGMRKSLYHYTGGFNANYRVGYWEDSDLNLFVRELGYKIMFTPKSVIYHKLSHTHSGSHPFTNFNKQFFFNRWINSGRIDRLVWEKRPDTPTVNSILLRRSGAHGDVLVAAGVASALKKKYNCNILFMTDCPSVIEQHPYIDRIISYNEVSERLFNIFYDLDMVYEYRPNANILNAYSEYVGVNKEDCNVCVYTEFIEVPDNYVVMHSGKTHWSGRNWQPDRFAKVSEHLRSKGHKVVCVGTIHDMELPCDVDLRGKTSIGQLSYVMQKSKLFIGIDSFPMHIAQATKTKGICFFGSIYSESRIYCKEMIGVSAENLPCLGCHHRKPYPCVLTNTCDVGGEPCITEFTVDTMIKYVDLYID